MDINKFVEVLNVTIKKQLLHYIVNIMSKLFAKLLLNNNKVLLLQIKKMIQLNNKQYDKLLGSVMSSKVDLSLYKKYNSVLDEDIDFDLNLLNSILNSSVLPQQRPRVNPKRVLLSLNIDTLDSDSVIDAGIDFLKHVKRL